MRGSWLEGRPVQGRVEVVLTFVLALAGGAFAVPAAAQIDTTATDTLGVPPVSDPGAIETTPPTLVPVADTLGAQEAAGPFAGFETFHLGNGLRVRWKRLAGAPDVHASVTVPYGSDQDPEGREETAHFLEHVLFSDHAGRSEEEIKDEIERRGGTRNGFTAPDRTFYFANLPRAHGTFGIEWLGRIVEPHALDSAVVERNRRPVVLEIGVREPQIQDRIWRWLNPSWLRPEGFWEREFERPVRSDRVYSRWDALQAIDAADLHAFYERYYTPRAMTVTVIGDLPRDSVAAAVQSAFGGLEGGPAPEAYPAPATPGEMTERYLWDFGANDRVWRYYRLVQPDQRTLTDAVLLRLFLERALNQRLRYGDEKAVYGISVGLTFRGDVGYLGISAPVEPDAFPLFERVLEEELDRLRTGAEPERFTTDRAALIEQLTGQNTTAEDVGGWIYRTLYAPGFETVPDLVGELERATPERLAEAAGALLVDENAFLQIARPHPLPMIAIGALVLLLAWGTWVLGAMVLRKKVRMDEVRFVGRIRTPILLQFARGFVLLVLAAIAGRALAWLWSWIGVRWVLPVDDYWIQMSAWSGMLVVTIALALVVLARIPRKILLFQDHLRVKMLAHASRKVPVGELVGARRVGFRLGRGVEVVRERKGTRKTMRWRLRDPDAFLRAAARIGIPELAEPEPEPKKKAKKEPSPPVPSGARVTPGSGGAPKAAREPAVDREPAEPDDPEVEALLRGDIPDSLRGE